MRRVWQFAIGLAIIAGTGVAAMPAFLSAAPSQTAQTETAAAEETVPNCDYYGSDPIDPERRRTSDGTWIDGKTSDTLDIARLERDCGGPAASRDLKQAEERTHAYIRARALMLSQRAGEAMGEFHLLCDADYGAACYQLALAQRVGKGGEPIDTQLARRNMEKAARLYVTVAGNELLQYADWVDMTEMPGFHRALRDGRLKEIPHTVSTQRVAITLYMRLYKQTNMFEQSIFTVDDETNKNKLIAHIVTERIQAIPGYLPPLFKPQPGRSGQNQLEQFVENMLASGAGVAALGQRAMAYEVGPAAVDAQTMISALSSQDSWQERNLYMKQLQKLMALWVQEPPQPDNDKVCALFQARLRRNCLPMADYNPGNPIEDLLSRLPRH